MDEALFSDSPGITKPLAYWIAVVVVLLPLVRCRARRTLMLLTNSTVPYNDSSRNQYRGAVSCTCMPPADFLCACHSTNVPKITSKVNVRCT